MNSHAQVVRPIALSPVAVPRRRRRRTEAMEATLAAFASPDTDKLGRALGFPVAVLAVTGDAALHAQRLSETWHACWTASDGEWFLPFDFGDSTARTTRFRQVRFDERWMGPRSLPDGMRLSEGSLRVTLSPGVDRVAQRPAEVRRRCATGRRLLVSARSAAAPPEGCAGRATLVEDLYAFHPRCFPSVVGAVLSSLRILTMCSALAGAAVASDGRDA